MCAYVHTYILTLYTYNNSKLNLKQEGGLGMVVIGKGSSE